MTSQTVLRTSDVLGLAHVRNKILDWATKTKRVNLRKAEDYDLTRLRSDTIPSTKECLHGTLSVARLILNCTEQLGHLSHEDTSSPISGFELQLESLVRANLDSFEHAGNTAYMVNMELSQCCARVERLKTVQERWEILTDCDSALRRAYKSLAALDATLAAAAHLEPALPIFTELDNSLRTRRYYAKLRGRMIQLACSKTSTPLQALRGCGTLIAMLIGDDIYGRLRMGDRKQIRELQDRILSWLREGGTDERAGEQLRADITAFVSMLRQVNQRQELIEHDSELLDKLVSKLANVEGQPTSDFLQDVQALSGLEEDLDNLLALEEVPDIALWNDALKRLQTLVGCRSSRRRFL